MEWSNEKNLVALCLNYACCDDILQPYVHKGHDMKLPLTFRATFRMKEFYDYKTEMYHGAFLRGASAQEALELGATTKDIQHDYRRGFIKFPSHEFDRPGHIYSAVEVAADHGIHHILDDIAKLMSPTVYTDYVLARTFVSHTLERAKYVFNDPIKSAFQGDQPLGDHGYARNVIPDPQAKTWCSIRMDLLARTRTTLRARARARMKEDFKSESKLTKDVYDLACSACSAR